MGSENNIKDLGWANGWIKTPDIVEKCRKLQHRVYDIDRSGMRGSKHEVRCDICRYVYRYDSS